MATSTASAAMPLAASKNAATPPAAAATVETWLADLGLEHDGLPEVLRSVANGSAIDDLHSIKEAELLLACGMEFAC